jgi:hypothetical protein
MKHRLLGIAALVCVAVILGSLGLYAQAVAIAEINGVVTL